MIENKLYIATQELRPEDRLPDRDVEHDDFFTRELPKRTMADVRVMSFNVRFDTARDGKNAWPNRKRGVVATILHHRPDIVGFQETLPHQQTYLEEQLRESG